MILWFANNSTINQQYRLLLYPIIHINVIKIYQPVAILPSTLSSIIANDHAWSELPARLRR